MKKITYISVLCLLLSYGRSQNLIVATTNSGGTATVTPITNGCTLDYTTSVGNVSSEQIRFLNNGTGYPTYSVLRKIITLNVQASTYFCFGMSCFDSTVNTPPTNFDYVTLAPGAYNQGFMTDLHEWTSVGYSLVRYKLYNVNNPNDTLSFYMRYNGLLGINANTEILESVTEVYPNPTASNAAINVNLKNEAEVKTAVYNALGSLVFTGTQKCLSGRNKIAIDCGNLNNGMYFVTIQADDSKITRRLVVNK